MEQRSVYQCYTCVICCNDVNTSKITTSISNKEEPDTSVITKLQFLVPEMEWSGQYSICEVCLEDLLSACIFKERCLKSQCSLVKTETTKEEFTPEIELDYEDKYNDIDLMKFEYDPSEEESNLSKPIETRPTESKIRYIRNKICDKCGRTYASIVSLKAHELVCDGIVRHWDKSRAKFKCDMCNKCYTTNKVLKVHMKSCSLKNIDLSRRPTDLDCEQSVIQTDQQETTPDIQSQPSKKSTRFRTFICEVCEAKFTILKDFLKHSETEHSMDIKTIRPYLCETCNAKFRTSSNLKDHQRRHGGDRPYICTYCGKSFRRRKDFSLHEPTHFNVRAFKCDSCEKTFKTNANLRTHQVVVHTSPSNWKYVCKFCKKRFPQKCTLDTHVRRHLGEKNFNCPICDRSFTTNDELKEHVSYHSNVRPFKCEHCVMEYKKRSTYKIHLRKVHGIGNAKLRTVEKKFSCHVCPAKFPYKGKLTRHLCVHFGLKPYSCTSCDKMFTDKSYLKYHLKIKHNVEEDSL